MIDLFPVIGPLLRSLDPEVAHTLTLRLLEAGLVPRDCEREEPRLRQRLWGLDFPHPVGLAAGFDKNAEAVGPLLGLGFGFVEAGTVTPRPQPGNPRPRCFRLTEQQAMINRFGFNNHGLDAVARRLATRRRRHRPGVVGVNIGRNKDSADAIADYVAGVYALAALADYLVINVSSPNTPGLRGLQDREPLAELLSAVLAARSELCLKRTPAVLLKIAPDLAPDALAAVTGVSLETGIDGLIISNTTIGRPGLEAVLGASEAGGLSGRPLFELSTRMLAETYRLTGGRLPLIGVGGIASAEDAYAKIRAGASLVQLYTALIYRGPRLVRDIRRGVSALMDRDGFATLGDAVGADHR